MFESAEIGHKISKEVYRAEVPALRAALLDAQIELYERKKMPVLVLISGQDGSGKGETINLLYEWMDPRFLSTLAFADPTDEERERPSMWRYWRSLPPKGRIGIFAGSWYSDPIRERLLGHISLKELDARADQINRFEAMLANEGALVIKFWFHLTKDAQRKRLKSLASDPRTAWRVTQWNWDRLKTFDKLQDAAGHMLRMTNTPQAPWVVLDASDDRYRNLTVGKVMLDAIRARLATDEPAHAPVAPMVRVDTDGRNVLTELDLTLKMEERQYETELSRWQARLFELTRDPRFKDRALVCAFEGADAAGKGGAIRRIASALDARQYQVVPIAAPNEAERAQPYLWRFWHHLPRRGHLTIFDRTWYGRVLVERVEGFCSENDWLRAYSEINDFEHELSAAGIIVIKFWLQTSRDEQLRRFEERAKVPFKRFKITEEDWRNREKWDAYQQAVCDMVERTSTGEAPWTLVESDDKRHARVKVLRTMCERLEAELERGAPGGKAPGLTMGAWDHAVPHRRATDKPSKSDSQPPHKDKVKRKDKAKGKKGKDRAD